jgi:hypothetical protein
VERSVNEMPTNAGPEADPGLRGACSTDGTRGHARSTDTGAAALRRPACARTVSIARLALAGLACAATAACVNPPGGDSRPRPETARASTPRDGDPERAAALKRADSAAFEPTTAGPNAPQGDGSITYRKLERSDFQAREPRPSAALAPGHVIAGTCAALAPRSTLRFRAVKQPGASEWVSEVQALAFEARMDPGCSWWGDTRSRPADYVLQHEQIHFAIIELAARELNRRAPELADAVRATGPTKEAAIEASRTRLLATLSEAVTRTRERSERFDAETSIGFTPDRQQAWADEVDAELRATEADAPPPAPGGS